MRKDDSSSIAIEIDYFLILMIPSSNPLGPHNPRISMISIAIIFGQCPPAVNN
jgi:hypothetical protein